MSPETITTEFHLDASTRSVDLGELQRRGSPPILVTVQGITDLGWLERRKLVAAFADYQRGGGKIVLFVAGSGPLADELVGLADAIVDGCGELRTFDAPRAHFITRGNLFTAQAVVGSLQ